MWRGLVLIVSALALPLAGSATPEEKPPPVEAGVKASAHKFVGVANCKLCHADDTTGNQYEQWKKSKHAGALRTLSSPGAKEIGAKLGIPDPSKDIKCLRCHVTGAEAPKSRKARTYKESDAVGCESCHGAGELYAKEEVFKQGKEAAMKLGLIEPTEQNCLGCHNKESPTFKEFDFKKRFEEVKHPNPKLKK